MSRCDALIRMKIRGTRCHPKSTVNHVPFYILSRGFGMPSCPTFSDERLVLRNKRQKEEVELIGAKLRTRK